MNKCRGFTLIEVLLGAAILSMLLIGAYYILVSGRRGTVLRQDAANQLLTGALLFRALDTDFRSILPGKIQIPGGETGGPIEFDGTPSQARMVLFWRFSGNRLVRVRYSCDPVAAEVLREELDHAGNTTSRFSFGSGLVTDFLINDPSGCGEQFLVTLTMRGKLKTMKTSRLFTHGFPGKSPAYHWQYHLDATP
jgi:prepilin-type N-terminal cleavage/methylation domain-containing protein